MLEIVEIFGGKERNRYCGHVTEEYQMQKKLALTVMMLTLIFLFGKRRDVKLVKTGSGWRMSMKSQ